MYTVYDSVTETLIGPFNDYESAEMFVLHASDALVDGGSNLTIESISEPEEWVQDNHLQLEVLIG
ncbi:hypothetical protein UFOVP27_20 [uncultured Caudovirales phage]|uniref:Uncharacterized protein n=1 Tax=uncultured Caudovirales phage TaxID=2100421 RepID=A0A6J5KIF2_9CAUD|nr:hypothetical protein UFOVP27_20 [uncultured Caudovirales phage]